MIDRISQRFVHDDDKVADKCQITLIYLSTQTNTPETNNAISVVKYMHIKFYIFLYSKNNQTHLFSIVYFSYKI